MVPIAVVGLSGRFPDAQSAAALWRNLLEGACAIGPVPAERARYWDLAGLERSSPGKPVVGGFLSDIERFDASFFGIPAAEAAVMDPQQRMFLEEAWRAFEDAGYSAEALSGRQCAVYVGSMMNEYHDLLTHTMALTPRAHEVTGVASYMPGRVAYHFNFRGPAVAIDTASSASLAAVHLACRALQTGEVEMALAGGVSLFLTEKRLRVLSAAGIITPEDRCRPFDEGSQGTLAAEGIAAVVLKRLDDAVRDGDAIHGVIRGTGMNQSGRTPGGITVPNLGSQIELMRQVYREAEVDPATIQYVEAHGTGTPRGDPIEAEALTTAITGTDAKGAAKGQLTPRATPCYLGAIKSNFGHAFAAAGAGGLIKVLMAMQHRTIPPQINFTELNRKVDRATWPFTLNAQPVSWERHGETPRRAVISGIGLSGTNCHCLVEEPPVLAARSVTMPKHGVWIVLSARTESALRQRAADLHAWLRDAAALTASRDKADRAVLLLDVAFTLSVGRTAFAERLAFVAKSLEEAEQNLARFLAGDVAASQILRGQAPASASANPAEVPFETTGATWVEGGTVSWAALFSGFEARRVHLPTYPFEGVATWYDLQGGVPVGTPGKAVAAASPSATPKPASVAAPVALSSPTIASPTAAKPLELRKTNASAAPESRPAGPIRLKVLAMAASAPESVVAPPASTATAPKPAIALKSTRAADAAPSLPTGAGRSGNMDTLTQLRAVVSKTLFVAPKRIFETSRLVEVGMDSMLAVQLAKALQATFGVTFSAGRLYDFGSLRELAAYLDQARTAGGVAVTPAVSGFQAAVPSTPSVVAKSATVAQPSGEVVAQVRALVAKTLFAPVERVSETAKFAELGLDSILAVELTKALRVTFDVSVSAGRLYDYATVAELAGYIERVRSGGEMADASVVTGFAAAPAPSAGPSPVVAAPPVASVPTSVSHAAVPAQPSADLIAQVRGLVAKTLFAPVDRVSEAAKFAELGLDSILAVELTKSLRAAFSVNVSAGRLYDYATVADLATYIERVRNGGEKADETVVTGFAAATVSPTAALGTPAIPAASAAPTPIVTSSPVLATSPALPSPELVAEVRGLVAKTLFAPVERVNETAKFAELGLDSILAVELTKALRANFGVNVSAGRLYDYATVADLAAYIGRVRSGGEVADESVLTGFAAAASPVASAPIAATAPTVSTTVTAAPPAIVAAQPRTETVTQVRALVAKTLFAPVDRVGENAKFAELGLDSILAVELTKALRATFDVNVSAGRLYDYATVSDLAAYIDRVRSGGEKADENVVTGFAAAAATPAPTAEAKRTILSTPAPVSAPAPIALNIVTRAPVAPAKPASVTSSARPIARIPRETPAAPAQVSAPATASVSAPASPSVPAPAAATAPGQAKPGFTPIAIVGYSGRFPGARNPEELWTLLANGKSTATEVPSARRALGDEPERLENPSAAVPGLKFGAFIDGIDEFDAGFFNLAPAEVERMDPQHRLFLQEAWRALEHAGYTPAATTKQRCGVFVGMSPSDYGHHVPEPDEHSFGGNAPAALPARVAYLLNWRGPVMAVDTACASTFTALDLACASLGRRETDLTMVGGVHVTSNHGERALIGQLGLLSPQGRCRSFDAAADGWILGEAVGVFVLKRLDDAERDGDEIHAVIRACGISQDGAKNGLLAPYSAGQSTLQKRIYAESGINPETVEYVEVHGTGTALADEVELLALNDSFRATTKARGTCAVSTLKPNIGHSMAAAGATCLIKALLSLKHGAITPIAGLETPNPALGLEGGPLFLNTTLRPWPARAGQPRRAAVNGQSALGTNCHIILDEWQPRAERSAAVAPGSRAVWVLSAQTSSQLRASAAALAEALRETPESELARVTWTLQAGRQAMPERLAFTAASIAEARTLLAEFATGRARPELHARRCEGIDEGISLLVDGPEGAQFVAAAVSAGALEKLAKLWVRGVAIDWALLYGGKTPRRIALPTYPFARERYWLQRREASAVKLATSSVAAVVPTPVIAGTSPLAEPGAAAVLHTIITKLLRAATGSVTVDGEMARAGFNSLYVLRATERFAAATGKRIPHRWFFECRTIRELGERVEREFGGVAVAEAQPASIAVAAPATTWPLTEGQTALWRIQHARPTSRAYHVPVALRWEGRVDRAALERALSTVANEQGALRLQFEQAGSEVRQRLTDAVAIQVQTLRCPEAELNDRLRELAATPLDLRNGPLWRAAILSTSASDVVVFGFHHLAFDGHSLGLFLERLQEAYASAVAGASMPARSNRSPQSLAASETAYLASAQAATDRAYWVQRYAKGFEPLLGPASTASAGDTGALLTKSISPTIVADLQRLATERRVTLQGVMLALYLALLGEEFGQQQVTTGVATDLRATEAELETIGYGVNILLVRAMVQRSDAVSDLCTRVFGRLLESLEHRRYSFRRLARAIAEQTGDARQAELDTCFYFQTALNDNSGTLARRLIPEVHQTGEFPLAFEVIDLGDETRLNVKYRPAVLSAERAERLADRYLAALGRLAGNGAASVAEVLGVDVASSERRPVAAENAFAFPDCCVSELFQQQAVKSPGALAAVFRDATLTYSELDARANRLAHHLTARGVRPGDLVAVSLRRSLDLLVSLLAVWKTGAAYVPVDPAYPEDRITAIMGDSGARFYLTHGAVKWRPAVATIVDVDAERSEIARQDDSAPAVTWTSTTLAYVIYTSGSTGRPKGVQVSQRNLVHFLCCMAQRPGCGPADRVLALTTICFDIAALELYLPLVTGGAVEIAPEELTKNGARLRAKLEEGTITLVQATPATWKMLLAAELGRVPHICALCGGEAWDAELAGQLLPRVRALWNMYGPTETTVWSSIAEVQPNAPIRLGEPIGNTQFYVLDENLKPVPKGEVGELFIGGDGVAVGYHNNPALSDERFMIIPHLANSRVYRTGDLVRHV